MKTLAMNLLLCSACIAGSAQNLRVTFTGTGDANRIDWIKATNLSTNESVTFPGKETLHLNYIYPEPGGVTDSPQPPAAGMIYPNPFQGTATVKMNVTASQNVNLTVRNLAGQVIAQTSQFVAAGENDFSVTLSDIGIFFITLSTAQGTVGHKAVCTEPGGAANTISHIGTSAFSGPDISMNGFKIAETHYHLSLDKNDVILYQCMSGNLTALITDLPRESKVYKVRFAACSDRMGRDYPVVNIGNQTWMAENLAMLPSVSPSEAGSVNSPYYYVYDFEDFNVVKARKTKSYREYGVLYNYEAAKTACPEGWRLPTDADWLRLEKFLGMEPVDAVEPGWRYTGSVGRKLKEGGTSHWARPNSEASNAAGFTARPGGIRLLPFPGVESRDGSGGQFGSFSYRGTCGVFWTATDLNSRTAWSRRFGCVEGGVERATMNKSLGFSVRCIKDRPEE